MSPEAYRSALLRAAEEGNWAEIERLSARYGWSLLRDIARRAWQSLIAWQASRRAHQPHGR